MNDKNLIYDTHEHPRTVKEWVLYAVQMLMAVFVATVLISTICGTPVDAGLLGACLGTLTYQLITKFKSPVFISNSGATVSAVMGALIIGSGVSAMQYGDMSYVEKLAINQNYFAVFIGGLVVLVIYVIFALVIKLRGIEAINKMFPPYIVGPVTIVIGLNLAKFIPSYTGATDIGTLVAIVVMIVVAVTSHYFKGFLKTIPFLIGLVFGFALCLVLELTGAADFEIVSKFQNINGFFNVPSFAFLN